MKKWVFLICVFGQGVTTAGTMSSSCERFDLTCQSNVWAFGAQALYLKPSLPGFGYAGDVPNSSTNSARYESADYNWDWGFKIEGAYYFDSGNSITANWYHWDNTFNTNEPSANFNTSSIDFSGSIQLNTAPKWDAVNIEWGKDINLAPRNNVRILAGVQYARLFSQTTITSTNSLLSTRVNTSTPGYSNENMSYGGFGPRVGVDLGYQIRQLPLSVHSELAASLLAGTQHFSSYYSAARIFGEGLNSASGSFVAVVPELEATLGFSYASSWMHQAWVIDVGWMWVNYFSALHTETSFGSTHETNFGMQGLYVGLKWRGQS